MEHIPFHKRCVVYYSCQKNIQAYAYMAFGQGLYSKVGVACMQVWFASMGFVPVGRVKHPGHNYVQALGRAINWVWLPTMPTKRVCHGHMMHCLLGNCDSIVHVQIAIERKTILSSSFLPTEHAQKQFWLQQFRKISLTLSTVAPSIIRHGSSKPTWHSKHTYTEVGGVELKCKVKVHACEREVALHTGPIASLHTWHNMKPVVRYLKVKQ